MNESRIFSALLAAGTALASVGAGLQWGAPVGLITCGAVTLGLTLYAVRLAARR